MNKTTLREQILMYFMTYGTIITEVFYILHENRSYVSKLISDMETDGLLAEKKLLIKDKGNKHYVRYKVITGKGVEYTKAHFAGNHPWLKFLRSPIPKFTMTTTTNQKMLVRHLKSVSAAIVFEQFDTGLSNGQLKTYYKGKSINFFDMVQEAKNGYMKYSQSNIDQKQSGKNKYIHASNMRSYFKLNEDDVSQNKFHQHIGILITAESFFFVYDAKPEGTCLNIEGLARVQTACRDIFGQFVDEYVLKRMGRVLAFTYSKNEFVKNYNTLSHCRTRAKGYRMDNLSAIYLMPMRYETRKLIRLMTEGVKDFTRTLMDRNAGITYGLSAPTYSHEKSFYLNYEGKPAVDGILFDVTEIKELCNKAKEKPKYEHILLCLDWQKEYYEALKLPPNIRLQAVVI